MLIASVAMLSPTTPKVDIEFDYLDKLVHLGTFAVLAFLLDSGWSESSYSFKKWGSLLIYGLVIEIAQHHIPNRGFEWFISVHRCGIAHVLRDGRVHCQTRTE